MILIVGHVRVREGAVEDLRTAMEAQIAASRAEPGCIDYSYAVDVLEPTRILVNEKWTDWTALEEHFKKPHMGPWREALGQAGISERALRAWEVGEGREI